MKYRACFLALSLAVSLSAGRPMDPHDHEAPRDSGKAGQATPGAENSGEAGCQVSPQRLADFANNEKQDFATLVTFITNPACALVHQKLSQAAISQGVNFPASGPFKLDQYAKNLSTGPSGAASDLDQILGKTVPQQLAENPLSSSELLAALGHVALLSPTAARVVLTTLIKQEIISADRKLAGAKADLKPGVAADLAATLLRMGVVDSVVGSDLGEAVEEMAFTVQAESLGQFFRGLAAAATAEATLAPTFNLSASALNRGVQKGKDVLSKEQQDKLLQAVFAAVKAGVSGSGLLEPGAIELNEALETLVDGRPLTVTGLRALWREATRILANSTTQPALAEAVSASLTPQMVFLRTDVRGSLLSAAINYPHLARAVQQNFVFAWVKAWNRMSSSEMSLRSFNRLKTVYFETMVPSILDFPADSVDLAWLRAVNRWGLLKDEEVEKKLPRLFLVQLEKRDKAVKAGLADESAESAVRALSEDFAVVWTLEQVHLPILNRWVKKHEQ